MTAFEPRAAGPVVIGNGQEKRGLIVRRTSRIIRGLTALAGLASAVPALAADDEARFRDLYRELVETNTTLSEGSCTAAAERMQARLIAAGMPRPDTEVIVSPDFPRQGNLIARLPGSDTKAPAILLIAHIDVVEAKRSDWKRDPFKLVEENGYFYARGAIDDKAMASAFVDALVRYREEGFKPRRTIKLALTCGEETDSVFNGVQYLLKTRPDALKAGFAVNEGGKGFLDAAGKPVLFGVQAGEKIYQDYKLVATSPGGHSSRPGKDNAITRLSNVLGRIGIFTFPVAPGEVARNFFAQSAALYEGQQRADMQAIGAGTADAATYARISDASPVWNATLRTTCVSTMVNAGHAPNALAQHAEATVNCRILPGQSVEDIRKALVQAGADPSVEIMLDGEPGPVSPAPPLTREIMAPVTALVREIWPGVPVIPSISTGATDGRFLLAAGIPTYGISAVFVDPDGNGVHGLDERVRVKSLLDARAFLYRLVKSYTNGRGGH